ncbi:MAG: hypothetical protein QW279_12320 [Candidatus Jordarchaeaceae archaeon]
MREIDPNYIGLIYGTLLRSLDRMGIKPNLISRHAAGVLSQLFDGPAKQVLDKKNLSTVEELMAQIEKLKTSKISENSYSGNTINKKVIGCMYLPLNNTGKSMGYKACPMCIQALLIASSLKALNLGEVKDIQVENNEDTCQLKIIL